MPQGDIHRCCSHSPSALCLGLRRLHPPQHHLLSPLPPPLLIARRIAKQPTSHIKGICNGYLFRGNPREDPDHIRRTVVVASAVAVGGGWWWWWWWRQRRIAMVEGVRTIANLPGHAPDNDNADKREHQVQQQWGATSAAPLPPWQWQQRGHRRSSSSLVVVARRFPPPHRWPLQCQPAAPSTAQGRMEQRGHREHQGVRWRRNPHPPRGPSPWLLPPSGRAGRVVYPSIPTLVAAKARPPCPPPPHQAWQLTPYGTSLDGS